MYLCGSTLFVNESAWQIRANQNLEIKKPHEIREAFLPNLNLKKFNVILLLIVRLQARHSLSSSGIPLPLRFVLRSQYSQD